jgi:hypothetical protein
MGSQTLDTYNRIYKRLSSDFYAEKIEDRSVMLIIDIFMSGQQKRNQASTLNPPSSYPTQSILSVNSFVEFTNKLRDGIVASFQHRSVGYDADIRR